MAQNQILFFPGIGGNEIRWIGSFLSAAGVVWVNTTRLALGGFQWLMLDPGGSGKASAWYPNTYAGDSVSYYYTALIDYFRQRGDRISDIRSDWRKRIEFDGAQAAQRILDAAALGPVTLVCHSRGGLLAAEAIRRLVALGDLAAIKQGISIGTPWRGSYEAAGYLGGYAQLPLTLDILGNLASLNATYFLRGRSVREVIASWPGVYELMPDPATAATNGDPHAEPWYNAVLWGGSGVPISDFHLTAARDRWRTPPTLPQTLKWVHIVGTGFRTRGPFIGTSPVGLPASVASSVEGDGTVPQWSAEALGGRIVRVNSSHSRMPTSPIVHGIIEGIMQE